MSNKLIYDWKNPQKQYKQEPNSREYTNPITGKVIGICERERNSVLSNVTALIQKKLPNISNIDELSNFTYSLITGDFKSELNNINLGLLPSIKSHDSRLADSTSLFSALVYCITTSVSEAERQAARVHCLASELSDESRKLLDQKINELNIELTPEHLSTIDTINKLCSSPDSTFIENIRDQFSIGLIMGGAQYIKSYFLESSKLSEIRGASYLIDYATGDLVRKVYMDEKEINCPEAIIYASGGSYLTFAPAAITTAIADKLESEFKKITISGHSCAAHMTTDLTYLLYGKDPEKSTGFFSEITAYLSNLVQLRRMGTDFSDRTNLDMPISTTLGPFIERCASCSLRAASISTEKGDSIRILCEACARKLIVGKFLKGKSDWDKELAKALSLTTTDFQLDPTRGWIKQFEKFLENNPDSKARYCKNYKINEASAPPDLLSISSNGMIGVIYADGNNVSSVLSAIKSPSGFRQLSEELDNACEYAVFKALADNLDLRIPADGSDSELINPFEILSIGGDDLFLIVPGNEALKIAADISKYFEKYLCNGTERKSKESTRYATEREVYDSRITLSCGVVIASAKTPVQFVFNLATDLLKQAKLKSKKQPDNARESCIDYEILNASNNLLENVEQFRQSSLTKKVDSSNGSITLRLTAKPYLRSEVIGLIDTCKEFRKADIPKTQLYSLRNSLSTGKARGKLEYFYARAKASNSNGSAAALFKILDDCWLNKSDGPWWKEEKDSTYCTMIPDLIELLSI